MQDIGDIAKKLGGSTEQPVIETEENGGSPAAAQNPPENNGGGEPPAGNPPKPVLPADIFGEEFKDKQWDEVKTDYTSRIQREKELSERLQEIESRQPEFADPEVAEYNAWIKNGGTKNYSLFNRIKSVGQETSDIDALVLQKVLENPAYIGHEEKLKAEILKDIPIVSTDDVELSEQDIAFNKAKLSEKATKAREYLKSQQEKLQVPATAATTDKAAVIAKRKEDWTAATETMFSALKTIPLQRVVKEGDKEKFEKVLDYQIPDHLIQSYKEQMISIYPNHADATPENLKIAQANVMKNIVFENLPYLFSSLLDAEKLKWEEEQEKIYGAAVRPKSPGGGSDGGGITDTVKGAKDHFSKI